MYRDICNNVLSCIWYIQYMNYVQYQWERIDGKRLNAHKHIINDL